MDFDDRFLNKPRKIDFIHYQAGAGGCFFRNLIALSCPLTKKVLTKQDHLSKDIDYTENGITKTYTVMRDVHYINNFFVNVFVSTSEKCKLPAEYIIKLYKSYVCHSILRSGNINEWDNTLVLFRGTWLLDDHVMKDIADNPYWDFVNINPFSKDSLKVMHRIMKVKGLNHNSDYRNKYDFMERLPLIDLLMSEDYNYVMDWIEKRYGSNLDFDFIESSLKEWKTVRIDPHL